MTGATATPHPDLVNRQFTAHHVPPPIVATGPDRL
jgi:hypothetical protein